VVLLGIYLQKKLKFGHREESRMKIIIPGKPVQKNRPRFARRGKFTKVYSDQDTESGLFFLKCREQVTEKLTGPLYVRFRFEVPRPKSHYGTGKNNGILKESAPKHAHGQRQDFDNLVKFACDCLNGLAWVDDRQIVESHVKKIWSDRPEDAKTVIIITELWED
jgi:Holliday junction resolvase RusA-like endonuclease